jgi:hypothetical protein
MALARTRRGESGLNYWPGFVDALSTLILSIIFILTVFVVVQFYLQQEVAGKDTALNRKRRSPIIEPCRWRNPARQLGTSWQFTPRSPAPRASATV